MILSVEFTPLVKDSHYSDMVVMSVLSYVKQRLSVFDVSR
jgi:hypothetical protein